VPSALVPLSENPYAQGVIPACGSGDLIRLSLSLVGEDAIILAIGKSRGG